MVAAATTAADAETAATAAASITALAHLGGRITPPLSGGSPDCTDTVSTYFYPFGHNFEVLPLGYIYL